MDGSRTSEEVEETGSSEEMQPLETQSITNWRFPVVVCW